MGDSDWGMGGGGQGGEQHLMEGDGQHVVHAVVVGREGDVGHLQENRAQDLPKHKQNTQRLATAIANT